MPDQTLDPTIDQLLQLTGALALPEALEAVRALKQELNLYRNGAAQEQARLENAFEEAPTEALDEPASIFPCWGVVQVMGHREVAGRLLLEPEARKLLRVEEPAGPTRLLGMPAIFSITVLPEEVVRELEIPESVRLDTPGAPANLRVDQGARGLTWPADRTDDYEAEEDPAFDEGFDEGHP